MPAIARRFPLLAALAAFTVLVFAAAPAAHAASARQLTLDGRRALDKLYAEEPRARLFGRHARAILVFPTIIKGGLVFGAETGDGVLLSRREEPMGFFNISAASWGLQAGGQAFSYALFFMNDRALRYLHRSGGWAIGTDPNIVVVNTGAAVAANSTTLSHDVYAFPFAQKGLMAGITIHGSKITQIHPD
ncbi:MAG: YSC84-related protein [Caulobacteraceae bacterium]